MRRNIGTIDRLARAAAGIVGLATGMVTQSSWGVLGLVPLVGYCPPYEILGIDTARKPDPSGPPADCSRSSHGCP